MGIQERRAREFDRRESEILAAALSLFTRDDWELVTVEEIARKAEVGKGTIYKHFESKDEIYARLALEFHRRLSLQLQQVDASLPVLTRFREMTRLAWEAHLSGKELHRVVLYCGRAEFRQSLPAALADEFAVVEAVTNEAIHANISRGVEEGLFPRKPLGMLLFGAQSAFWGAVQLIWSGYLGEPDQARYCDEITNFILAGLIYQDRRLPA
ncbi:MAG: TetR/AcrR family transcriptional regulator [Candidatus Accumulibacter meliphilus]|jgi:AcrR family transcriptional regulator|uniref:TetR/AcrR family transcriptional regulator n=1 Tax=Candidatus Accumulibacter meliphilus TaxID=2211374 RepID=UPI002FC3CCFC